MNTDDFLLANANPRRGGVTCRTCALDKKKREAIERAAKRFTQAHTEGIEVEGQLIKSTLPWTTFVNQHIIPEFKYPYKHRALKDHMENCLGVQVP